MENRIDEYLQLLLVSGVNIKKGQKLVIRSEVECAVYARILMKKAYELGAKYVVITWSDAVATRETFLNADVSVFDDVEPWHNALNYTLAKEGAAFLSIISSDPENLKGVESSRIVRRAKMLNNSMKDYRALTMSNLIRWCVASIPSVAWAKKVFPNSKSDEIAVAELWNKILDSSRVEVGNTSKNWKNHTDTLIHRAETLNKYNFKSIHFKNSLGTDLIVELAEGHIWMGGQEKDGEGVYFSANIPTEEIFTCPKRTGVNGVVRSTKPFIYNGNVISDFTVCFENGKAVKIEAKENQELLQKLITIDSNASFLGEIALVANNSPISLSNVLYYNTLYDENASCHLAFGKAYPYTVKGAVGKTPEELLKIGINDSDVHEDFMIGSPDLIVVGNTFDGLDIEIIKDGEFLF